MPSHDMVHIYRQHPRGISPRELDGLIAVLRLIAIVAKKVSLPNLSPAFSQCPGFFLEDCFHIAG